MSAMFNACLVLNSSKCITMYESFWNRTWKVDLYYFGMSWRLKDKLTSRLMMFCKVDNGLAEVSCPGAGTPDTEIQTKPRKDFQEVRTQDRLQAELAFPRDCETVERPPPPLPKILWTLQSLDIFNGVTPTEPFSLHLVLQPRYTSVMVTQLTVDVFTRKKKRKAERWSRW